MLQPDVAREERLEYMRSKFTEQVRRFRESVRMYNRALAVQSRTRGIVQPLPPDRLPVGGRVAFPAAPAVVGLTARQMQIAELIAKGYTNNQIADALVVTQGTVANHVQHILERLELRSRTQVAVWFSTHPAKREQRAAR
jgi:DNA-binding NarL/FixJ family response regulator